MYDLIIIGAGPAGLGAAVAAAEKLNTLVIAKAVFEPKPEAVALGFFRLGDLADKFYACVNIHQLALKDKTEVITLEKNIVSFSVEIKNGTLYYAKAVIIATGSEPLEFDGVTQKTGEGSIKVDGNQQTSVPGILAAGQVANTKLINELVAIGEGAKAVLWAK